MLSRKTKFFLGGVLASLVISAAVLSVVFTSKSNRAHQLEFDGRISLRNIDMSLQSSTQKMTMLVQEGRVVRRKRRISRVDLRSEIKN